MHDRVDPNSNFERTRRQVSYLSRAEADKSVYTSLGFRCGLEIHQQLDTAQKLFCRCPAGIYQNGDDYDSEIVRHMRPTLSELGEYDGTALMEFKTRKNIIYRIKNETACTYEIDDTPPFPLNREALHIAIEIALLLKTNVVGELHITRKQYLDGSIPTGFQRTAIVGIEGSIPLPNKNVRIIQLSLEEDSCREVSDVGHWRTYTTDRLGMPLIESVTYPDMTTPDEAAEAAHYLRFLARSSGKVRTGIGAARQDVNVSITGGTRVEIKGVAHIKWIPELTHVEAFRQKALLAIRAILHDRFGKSDKWSINHKDLDFGQLPVDYTPLCTARDAKQRLTAVNLPGFAGLLSHFTQPGKVFANEISDRLKVIACLEKPNMLHSEQGQPVLSEGLLASIRRHLGSGPQDAQILIWGASADIDTAVETIEERCRLAFDGVPNETRKALRDGTTIFERVLPGPDRMYPDTDSAPIPIQNEIIDQARGQIPVSVRDRLTQLRDWGIPPDTYTFLLKRNLLPLIDKITGTGSMDPRFIGTLLGHTLKSLEGRGPCADGFSYNKIYGLAKFVKSRNLVPEIMKAMMPVIYEHPGIAFDSALTVIDHQSITDNDIMSYVPALKMRFKPKSGSVVSGACTEWIMGNLRKLALGNIPLRELRALVVREVGRD